MEALHHSESAVPLKGPDGFYLIQLETTASELAFNPSTAVRSFNNKLKADQVSKYGAFSKVLHIKDDWRLSVRFGSRNFQEASATSKFRCQISFRDTVVTVDAATVLLCKEICAREFFAKMELAYGYVPPQHEFFDEIMTGSEIYRDILNSIQPQPILVTQHLATYHNELTDENVYITSILVSPKRMTCIERLMFRGTHKIKEFSRIQAARKIYKYMFNHEFPRATYMLVDENDIRINAKYNWRSIYYPRGIQSNQQNIQLSNPYSDSATTQHKTTNNNSFGPETYYTGLQTRSDQTRTEQYLPQIQPTTPQTHPNTTYNGFFGENYVSSSGTLPVQETNFIHGGQNFVYSTYV